MGHLIWIESSQREEFKKHIFRLRKLFFHHFFRKSQLRLELFKIFSYKSESWPKLDLWLVTFVQVWIFIKKMIILIFYSCVKKFINKDVIPIQSHNFNIIIIIIISRLQTQQVYRRSQFSISILFYYMLLFLSRRLMVEFHC